MGKAPIYQRASRASRFALFLLSKVLMVELVFSLSSQCISRRFFLFCSSVTLSSPKPVSASLLPTSISSNELAEIFSTNRNIRNSDVFSSVPGKQNQLQQERAPVQELEDWRLDQCEDKGKDWEQCFFFGTDAASQGRGGKIIMKEKPRVKGGPPTW